LLRSKLKPGPDGEPDKMVLPSVAITEKEIKAKSASGKVI
jgi:hypothetical protein